MEVETRRKLLKIINMPKWSKEELEELGELMRSEVEYSLKLRKTMRARYPELIRRS